MPFVALHEFHHISTHLGNMSHQRGPVHMATLAEHPPKEAPGVLVSTNISTAI